MFYQRMVSRAPTDRDGEKSDAHNFHQDKIMKTENYLRTCTCYKYIFELLPWIRFIIASEANSGPCRRKLVSKASVWCFFCCCPVFLFFFCLLFLSFSLCLLAALKLPDQDQQCPHLLKPTTISRWYQGGRLGGVKGAAAFNLVFVFVFCLLSLSLCLSRWCQGGRRLQPRLQIMSFQQLSSSSEILSQESFKTFTFSFKTLRILKREHSSGFGF